MRGRAICILASFVLIAVGCSSEDSTDGRARSQESKIQALEARVQVLEEQTGAEARYRDLDAGDLLDRAVVELEANQPFTNGPYRVARTNIAISERRPEGVTVPVIVVDGDQRFCPPSPECMAVAEPPAARSPVSAAVAVWSPLGCRYAVYDPASGWWVAQSAMVSVQAATVCDPGAASADYAISPGRSGSRRGLDSIGLRWESRTVGDSQ